jgi:anti-sigma factor RsiW
MTELSDDLLMAYVEGQLAREQTRAVEKVLKHDGVLAERVAALQEAHRRLEIAFEAILVSEVGELAAEPQLALAERRESERQQRRGREGLRLAAMLAAGALAAAGIVGWPLLRLEFDALREALLPPPAQAPTPAFAWQDNAAGAQSLLGRASLEVGLESQGNGDFVAFQLAEAIGPELRVPDLKAQGYHFVRAALLRYGDRPLAQMMYLPARRGPLSLFAMEGKGERAPVFRQIAGIGTVAWSGNGIEYLLAASEDAAVLYRIAEKIRHEPLAPEPESPAPTASNEVPATSPTASVPPAAPASAQSIPAAATPEASAPN